jgi:glycolate oxidase iron-sulfur subunit
MQQQATQTGSALRHEASKLLACIHCGLCLEACPTYVATGDENDGPRGRIYLMRAVEEGRLSAAVDTFRRHIDRCLGCRACESACPAGVEYGQLLEAARADLAATREQRSLTDTLLRFVLRHVWLHPARLRFAFTLARLTRDTGLPRLLRATKLPRLLTPRLDLALALLAGSAPVSLSADGAVESAHAAAASPRRTSPPAHGGLGDDAPRTGTPSTSAAQTQSSTPSTPVVQAQVSTRALLFEGCVTEGLFARVNRATERVLRANDCAAVRPRGQVCCGALHAHAGDLAGARRLARQNIEAFTDGAETPIVTNAGGCGAMLASYAHLLADDELYAARARAFAARVRDVSQQLRATGLRAGAPLDAPLTTYDASCHLLHGQRAALEPLATLRAIPALRFVPLAGSDVCCGGAGVYNLIETELSARVLAEKLRHIRATGAELLATGNPGCHMQLSAGAQLDGLTLRVCHPIELLDESYRRAGFYAASDK